MALEFPGDSQGKESAYNAGDLGSIPGQDSVFLPGDSWTEEPVRLQSVRQ